MELVYRDKAKPAEMTTGKPLFTLDELKAYGAHVEQDALERAARACEKRRDERFNDYGTREHDTGACYYGGGRAEEFDTRDEEDESCAEDIRKLPRIC